MSIRRFIQKLKSFFVQTPSEETPNQDESVSGAVRKDEPGGTGEAVRDNVAPEFKGEVSEEQTPKQDEIPPADVPPKDDSEPVPAGAAPSKEVN